MKVLPNKEEHWSRFPELRRTFNDSPVPDRFFHNGGIRSPYTTVFDDLHDLAEIGAIRKLTTRYEAIQKGTI